MTEANPSGDREISFLVIGTRLLRYRGRILRWMLVGGVLAGLSVLTKPVVYVATASFIPQGSNDAGRSGLAGLAGQFGVSFPSTTQSLSPEFYANLLKSRVLLAPISHDTLTVSELSGKRVAFTELVKIHEASPGIREESGIRALQGMVGVAIDKMTGVVNLSVSSPWRSVSLAIAAKLVNGVNDYNERTRQGQAAAERKFVEGRLALAGADLRAAEDRYAEFLRTNRDLGNSSELAMRRDRLQRDLNFRQQVFTSLTQSYEEARIREVRDTPMITMFEPPSVPTYPAARGRLKRALLGLVLGGLFGVVLAFVRDAIARRRGEGDPEVEEFVGIVSQIKNEILHPLRSARGRVGA